MFGGIVRECGSVFSPQLTNSQSALACFPTSCMRGKIVCCLPTRIHLTHNMYVQWHFPWLQMKWICLIQPRWFCSWHDTRLPTLPRFLTLFVYLPEIQKKKIHPSLSLTMTRGEEEERHGTFCLSGYIHPYSVSDDKQTCIGYREAAVLCLATGNNTATLQE